MSRPLFFYSDKLLDYDMGPQHPMRPERLQMTRDLLASYGLFDTVLDEVAPDLATIDDVLTTHSRDYIEAIDRLGTGDYFPAPHRYGFGTGDNPIFPQMYEASMRYTGASVGAAQAVIDGAEVAFNISGGLHHAHHAKASGFCVLNDCAIAIHRLRRRFARVAYVDIDVHHGDGVQEAFYADPSVLTVSLHESGRTLFPGTGFTFEIGKFEGEGRCVNLPFAPFATDEVWLDAWRSAALPILRAFDPHAILLQIGADAHNLDPLGHIALTAQGWLEAIRDVRSLERPLVVVGGGGYNLTTVPRMWTLAVAELAGATLTDEIPEGYRHRPAAATLTDHALPEIKPEECERARFAANEAVLELQDLLFTRYSLS